MKDVEEETITHHLCFCFALSSTSQNFGTLLLASLSKIANVKVTDLMRFKTDC